VIELRADFLVTADSMLYNIVNTHSEVAVRLLGGGQDDALS